jgi:purine-binding chemotaxis protein CheW
MKNSGDTTQVLTVYMNGKTFGIPIQTIQDVLMTQPVTAVPLAGLAVKGVMNLRGRIVTIIDLPVYLGLSSGVSENGMNVVLESGNELFSFLVDGVGDVITILPDIAEDLPPTLDPLWKSVASHIYPLAETLMIVLKPSAIFATFGAHSRNNSLFSSEGERVL